MITDKNISRKLRNNNIKDFNTPEEFNEFLSNAYLELGDVRSLQILNPLTGSEWYDSNNIPETITEFCRDPNYLHFVAKHILNVELLPYQCVILQILWNKTLPLVVASRGAAKSFILSVYMTLRCLLHQGANIIIVGAALRQSMVLFHYLEKIWENAPVLRDIVGSRNHPKRDLHMAFWNCGISKALFLPVGSGDKIRGQRACVGPNTLIETNKGLIRIKDSSQYMQDLLIHVGDGEYEQPKYFLQTHPIDAYEITTMGGYNFVCSDIHKVMTTNGWKLGKDLTSDDYLPFENNYEFPNEYLNIDGYDIDENFAFMLGLLVSEGAVSSKHSINLKMIDKVCVDKFQESLLAIDPTFNVRRYEYEAREDKRGWNCKPIFEAGLCNLKFRDTLVKCGLDRVTALNKSVPNCILQSSKSVVLGFLKGLFWGDGSCYLFKDKTRDNNLGIAYYSSSKQLIDDVQVLLQKLGFFAGKASRPSRLSKNPNYFIRLYGYRARELYRLLLIDKWHDAYEKCYKDEKSKGIHTELRVKKVEKLEGKHILYDYTLPKNQCFIGNGFKQHNTHILCDEIASLPPEIFETVVRGFASVRSEGLVDNVIHAHKLKLAGEMGISFNADEVTTEVGISTILKNNQIVMAGTASYTFNHMYKYYQHYTAIIRSGGNRKILKQMFPEMDIKEDIDPSQYAVIQLPYDKLPPGMMDTKILEQGRATMDRSIYANEYGAVFSPDSEGFYLASVIQKATCPITINDKQYNFNALLAGDRKNSYVMGIDPASESDNFAICIEELDDKIGRVVYQWTTNRKKFEKDKLDGKVTVGIEDYNTYCIRHIRMLLRRFNIILVCLDAAGGGLWVKEGLRDPGKMVAGDQIIQDMDEEGPAVGEKILKMIQFSDTLWRKEAHWGLKKDLMDHLVLFPYFDAAEIELDNVARSSNNPYPETMEDTYDEILQLKTEMTFIKYSQTTNATETWDIPKLKGVNAEAIKKTLKKDRFTSLLLANWARRLTIDSQGGPTHYIKECYGGVSRELIDNNPGTYQGISIRNHGGGNRRICY